MSRAVDLVAALPTCLDADLRRQGPPSTGGNTVGGVPLALKRWRLAEHVDKMLRDRNGFVPQLTGIGMPLPLRAFTAETGDQTDDA